MPQLINCYAIQPVPSLVARYIVFLYNHNDECGDVLGRNSVKLIELFLPKAMCFILDNSKFVDSMMCILIVEVQINSV